MELFQFVGAMVTLFLNVLILRNVVDAAAFKLTFHKQTDPSLLKQALNVSSDNKIPESEVVRLRFLSKRSADDQEVIRVHFSAFGRDIHLHLQRNEDFDDKLNTMRVFEAKLTEKGSIELNEVIFEDKDSGTPYIDPVHMAAVNIRHGPDGKLQMEGMIGDDLFIEPAPADINFLSDYYTYDWKFADESTNGSHSSEKLTVDSDFEYFSSTAATIGVHIVHKSLSKTKKSVKVALNDVLNAMPDSLTDGNLHQRPASPLHVWVEVLLMVDFDTYAMHLSHGWNETQIRRYYVSFLNGVDLRFKTISNPKISLVLSQIIIFKSRDATPFLQKHIYPQEVVFNGNKALSDFARHLYEARMQHGLYAEFDVAVLMTNLDMCTEQIIFCNTATVGLAYFKGACCVLDGERWMGVAIVEDNGGFDGILTAAHEIGHLLGVDHDGSRHSLLDAGDFSFCDPDEGYIMSNAATSDRIFQWSECSIKQFRYFFNSGKVSCILNEPSYPNELVESELPGVVLSLDEQCERAWGTRACAWDGRVCVSLRCYKPEDPDVNFCLSGLPPAAEGSACGKDLHCRHGKCLPNDLIYSPAWNMVPIHDVLKYKNIEGSSGTIEPSSNEDCEEYSIEFCETYFLSVGSEEACKNSRIIEECCYSQKFYCQIELL